MTHNEYDKLFEKAKMQISVDKIHQAITSLELIIKNDTNPPLKILTMYAKLLERTQQLDNAKSAYQVIATKHPESPSGFEGLSRICLAQNKAEKALKVVNQGILLFPLSASLNELKAKALSKLSSYIEARNIYSILADKHPDQPHGLLGLIQLSLMQKMYSKTIKLAQKLLQSFPNNEAAHIALAKAFKELTRYNEAIEQYWVIIRLFPNNSQAHLNLSQIYSSLGNHKAAKQEIKSAYDLNPTNIRIVKQYIHIYEALNEPQRAIRFIDEHIKRTNQKKGLTTHAKLLYKYNDIQSFNDLIINNQQFFINNPSTLLEIALFLKNLGHLNHAAILFSQILANKSTQFNHLKINFESHKQLTQLYHISDLIRPDVQNLPTSVKKSFFEIGKYKVTNLYNNEALITVQKKVSKDLCFETNRNHHELLFIALFKNYNLHIIQIQKKILFRLLNTETNPKESIQLAQIIKNKIQNKTPCSIIRLGDGEGIFLDYESKFKKFQEQDMATIQERWWGAEKAKGKAAAEIQSQLKKSIENADIIGVPNIFRMIKSKQQNLSKISIHERGLLGIYNYMSYAFTPKRKPILTSCHFQNDFEFWNLYNYIFSDLSCVTIITCHKGISDTLRSKFGIINIKEIIIPPESFHSHKFGSPSETNSHYPEVYKNLTQTIEIEHGEVCLVAAGILGKVYCNLIKNKGGIGIDIGSITDTWMNYNTRKAHKILGPLKNCLTDLENLISKVTPPGK